MNSQTVKLMESHFDTAFAAPDGIKRLRELILTLAMQGKLVPQDPHDQPARELLKEIGAEKRRLVKAGKIKEPRPLLEISAEELPYALPKGWEWVRLNNFGIWKSGSTPSRQNSSFYGGDIPWVKSGEVKRGRISETEEKITQTALDNCSLHLNPIGSVLIAMYGANIGEVGVLEIEATTNQAVCACKPYSGISNIYLIHLITSLKEDFIAQGAGAAQPNISREKIVNTIVPLPPLAEQHRIVARIDQLMARCDKLEKLRAEREQKRLTVHTAALNRLLTAQESNTFTDAWQFIIRHFGELYSVRENVAELRKAILQLAIMGKLVPQGPHDQPAKKLLQEIEAEKKRLVNEGKIKAPKPLPSIKPEEVPFSLPESWEWARLGNLVNVKSSKRIFESDYCETGIPFYRSREIGELARNGFCEDRLFISEEKYFEISNEYRVPKPGDILLTSVGSIGGCWKVDDRKFYYKDGNVTQLETGAYIDSSYIIRFINSNLFTGQVLESVSGTAYNALTIIKINSLKFPLPPLMEQRRIVAKIDQLMTLCDELEKQIDISTQKQTSLLSAVMAQV